MQRYGQAKSEMPKKPFNPAPGSNRPISLSNNVPHLRRLNVNWVNNSRNPVKLPTRGFTSNMFIPGERECHGDIARMMKTAQSSPRSLSPGPRFDVAKLEMIMSEFLENLHQNQRAKDCKKTGFRELTAMEFNEEQLKRQHIIQLEKPPMADTNSMLFTVKDNAWNPQFSPQWYATPSQEVKDPMLWQHNSFPTFANNSMKSQTQSSGQYSDMPYTYCSANMKMADTDALQSKVANPISSLLYSYDDYIHSGHGLKSGYPVRGAYYTADPTSLNDGFHAQKNNLEVYNMVNNNMNKTAIQPIGAFGFQTVNNNQKNSNMRMADSSPAAFNSKIFPNLPPFEYMRPICKQRSDGIPMEQLPIMSYNCPSGHDKPNPSVNGTNAFTPTMGSTTSVFNLQPQLANAQLPPYQSSHKTTEPKRYKYGGIPQTEVSPKPWLLQQAHAKMASHEHAQPIICVQPNVQVLPQSHFQLPNFVTEPNPNVRNYPKLLSSNTCPRHAATVLMPQTQDNYHMHNIGKTQHEPSQPINILEYVKSFVASSNANRGNHNINHHNNICQRQPFVAASLNHNSDQFKHHMSTTAKWRSETNLENLEKVNSTLTPDNIDENLCQLETDHSGNIYEHKKRSELTEGGISAARKTCRRGRSRGVREVFGIITPHHGNNNINDKLIASSNTRLNTKVANAGVNSKIIGKHVDIAKAVISLFDDNVSSVKGATHSNYNSNNHNLHLNNQNFWVDN